MQNSESRGGIAPWRCGPIAHAPCLGLVLGLALVLVAMPARAQTDITIDGGTSATVPGDYASPWTDPDELLIGDTGTGSLTVESGGKVDAYTAVLGDDTGADGTLTVTGDGSNLDTDTSNLIVGNYGTGTVTVSDEASLTSRYGIVAEGGTGVGNVTITGDSSRWDIANELILGRDGTGKLKVENGGHADIDGSILIGDDSAGAGAGSGTLILRGADSEVVTGSYTSIGQRNSGSGTMRIENGARLDTNQGLVGWKANTDGTLRVTGAGSEWIGSGYLAVGYSGTGEATVDSGGLIRVDNGTGDLDIAGFAGAKGTVNIGAAAGDTARAAGTIDVASVDMGNGDAELVFNHTETGYEFSPEINGAGDITHVNGTTRLTGDSSGFAGTTTVSGGELSVAGRLGGDISVGAGGTLGGGGRVGGLEVSGALAPGSSVGTLDVDGDVTFKGGATYEVEVDAGGADRVSAGGTATLDGDVAVTSLAPDEDTSVIGDYTIVSATGGVTGTFDGVTANYAFLEPSLSYTADSAVLTLGYDGEPSDLLSGFARGRNARSVVDTLDSVDKSDPGYTAFENALLTLKSGQEEAAARELSGETLPTVDSNVAKVNNSFLSSIQGRISGGGGGSLASLAGAAGAARGIQLAARERETTYVAPQPALPALPDASGRSRLQGSATWARVVGQESTLDARGGVAGVTQRSSGVHGGVEMPLGDGAGDGLMLGGAVGFEHGRLESGRTTRSDFKAYSAGAYVRQRIGNVRLSGSGSHTRTVLDSRRRVTGFGVQRADYAARIWSLDSEIAYDIDVADGIAVSPLAGLRYSYTERDRYQERGTAGLTVPRSTAHALRGRLGAEAAFDVAPITFSLRAAWSRGIKRPDATTDASLLGGDTFTIDGQNLPQDIAEIGLGADVTLGDGVEVFAAYDGRFAGRYRSHNGQLGMRIAF